MSNAVATTNKAVALAQYLDTRKDDFAAVSLVDPEKFMRTVKNALMKDPQIAEASTQSVFLECQKAIADGLVLDGREAALTRFNTNKKRKSESGQWVDNWVTEVVYIPMVAGIMKRVRNSGEVASWSAELVYEKEYETGRFVYKAGADPHIHHEPIIVGERGPVVAAYSAVKLRDGTYSYEVMNIDQLNSIRNRTKSKRKDGSIAGPWQTDVEEMYRKTVIRRHAKRLPVSSDVLGVTQRVDSMYPDGFEEAEVIQETKPVRVSAAQKLSEAMQKEEPEVAEPALEGDIITEDGEILEAEVADPEDEF